MFCLLVGLHFSCFHNLSFATELGGQGRYSTFIKFTYNQKEHILIAYGSSSGCLAVEWKGSDR